MPSRAMGSGRVGAAPRAGDKRFNGLRPSSGTGVAPAGGQIRRHPRCPAAHQDAAQGLYGRRRARWSTPRSLRGAASTEYARVLRVAEAEAQAVVAREFAAVHSVDRALAVGSLEVILAPRNLRPALIERIRATPPY